MFQCPECGYKDLPVWKACKWRRYSVYCHTSELLEFKPDLVKRLKEESWVKEGPYYYKLTRKGDIIYRMLEMGKSEFKTHGFTEKPADPFQQKLMKEAEP